MTLYVYNFDEAGNPNSKVAFNGNLYDASAVTWRLKLTSRYTNKGLDNTHATQTYWVLELELDTYNDRYTEFNITNLSQDLLGNEFASGYYNYEILWSDSDVDPTADPDIYNWTLAQDGLLKLKTSATEDLAFEGPEKDYFPTNHYQGPNPDAESYVIYKD